MASGRAFLDNIKAPFTAPEQSSSADFNPRRLQEEQTCVPASDQKAARRTSIREEDLGISPKTAASERVNKCIKDSSQVNPETEMSEPSINHKNQNNQHLSSQSREEASYIIAGEKERECDSMDSGVQAQDHSSHHSSDSDMEIEEVSVNEEIPLINSATKKLDLCVSDSSGKMADIKKIKKSNPLPDQFCDVCGLGEEVVNCTNCKCLKSYHADCHLPPIDICKSFICTMCQRPKELKGDEEAKQELICRKVFLQLLTRRSQTKHLMNMQLSSVQEKLASRIFGSPDGFCDLIKCRQEFSHNRMHVLHFIKVVSKVF